MVKLRFSHHDNGEGFSNYCNRFSIRALNLVLLSETMKYFHGKVAILLHVHITLKNTCFCDLSFILAVKCTI